MKLYSHLPFCANLRPMMKKKLPKSVAKLNEHYNEYTK